MDHLRFLTCALLICGCGVSTDKEDGIDDPIGADGKADGGFSTAEIAGALRVANELSLDALDHDVGLTSRAAANLVDWRNGPDAVAGTADDAPFATLAELDAVPYIGPVSLSHLVDHARALGWIAVSTLQRLAPTTSADGADFGVTIAQAGSWLAVAAPGAGRGLVYMYERAGSAWTLAATLESPDTADNDAGYGLSLDGATLAFTAQKLNAARTDYVKHVYVFVRSNATWTLQQSLEIDASSLALSGDTLAVKVPDDTAAGGAQVVVYRRSGSTWSEEATLTDTLSGSTNPPDYFAVSIALDHDTLAVSSFNGSLAPRDGNDVRRIGAVDVYTRTGSTWTPVRLKPDQASAEYGGNFGEDLALDANTLVVGAPSADGPSGLQHGGSATIYARAGASWKRQAVVHSSMPIRNAQFGGSVDVSGGRIVVGADSDGTVYTTFPYTNLSGAAYVFDRTGTTWSESERLTAPTPKSYAAFGGKVQLEGATLVVSAWQESVWRNTATGQTLETVGAVYAR